MKKLEKKNVLSKLFRIGLIFIILFFVFVFVAGIITYWGLTYVKENTQPNIQKYEEIRQRVLKQSENFLNKFNEAFISLRYEDTFVFRNKISELKNILIDFSNDYEFLCSFQESNRELFPNITNSDIQTCKGLVKIYSECFPKYLDSLYSLSYLVDQAKQLKTEEDLNKYKNSCNSWLLDYNFIRGSCETISKMYGLNFTFPDLSEICK